MSSITSFIERKKNKTKSIKLTKTTINKKDTQLAYKHDINQKRKEKFYVHPDRPTISEDQTKMLANYLKITYYVDSQIIQYKPIEERLEVRQRKHEKVQSDDEESLKSILKELVKARLPSNPIYFANNEQIKYRSNYFPKKNNKYKNISLQNMDYRISLEVTQDINTTPGTRSTTNELENNPCSNCTVF
jgi:hypothetical protein